MAAGRARYPNAPPFGCQTAAWGQAALPVMAASAFLWHCNVRRDRCNGSCGVRRFFSALTAPDREPAWNERSPSSRRLCSERAGVCLTTEGTERGTEIGAGVEPELFSVCLGALGGVMELQNVPCSPDIFSVGHVSSHGRL